MKAWCVGTAILFENPVPGWVWLGSCCIFFDWAGWIEHDEELVDLVAAAATYSVAVATRATYSVVAAVEAANSSRATRTSVA